MSDQLSLESKIFEFREKRLEINGIAAEQLAVIFNNFLTKSTRLKLNNSLFIFENEGSAEDYFQLLKKNHNCVFYPGLGSDAYSSIVPSEKNLFDRFNIINRLHEKENLIIITTIEAARLYVPDQEFFSKKIEVEISSIIPPHQLATQLVELGYHKTISTEEPGTFSNRGEIFDIYPINSPPLRIYYFDDMIEEIFRIDPDTLKTLRDSAVEKVSISKTPHSLLEEKWINNFKERLPRPTPGQKELYDVKKSITTRINNKQLFEDYPLFINYFFKEKNTLLNYTNNTQVFLMESFRTKQTSEELDTENQKSFDQLHNHNEYHIKPTPQDVYSPLDIESLSPAICVNSLVVNKKLDDNNLDEIELNIAPLHYKKDINRKQNIQNLTTFISEQISKNSTLYLVCPDKNTEKEITYILEKKIENFAHLKHKVHYLQGNLSAGFSYKNEKLYFISSSDFYNQKKKKTKHHKKNINEDLFAEQLSTLLIGDFIIHKDHGVGKYLGIESLELAGNTSDYIVLEYQDNDKVYVPVYRLNLLQKYATNQVSVTVANLKSKKFELLKAKAKKSVKKLAFDLIELQAKRKMQKSFSFSPPDDDYNEFSQSFKFQETPDQDQAIEDVLSDMQTDKPMDRLICGDVGFGKTEVAMRASYLSVLSGKQVCILVPTTVLCLQHYNSFVQRFNGTPVVIESLSRFKTPKQSKEIIQNLSEGKIDIIIGTHKLLSDQIKYHDLGLIIIDEEQRFGVGHKEKLKLLRETIDTLTLTATPIPRTLQMSFLGIKELSLIKTAPPRRQSIKTYIVKEDLQTIKQAIEKELSRGGQVFIVHNKVQDMEIYTSKIRELVPNAKIIYAHGQMSEKELEKRIADFYQHKFDILISTTIIESGIDIANANTMIIDRADTYGLSQLHQLRGRIGRSDRKAYAYFVIPKTRKLTDIATKRLKALQTYAELGSGFSLASSDLEIRGSGDILGAEQSGHLANIGLELYMELLQDAIHQLKGESKDIYQDVEIQSSYNTFIPKNYIENSNQRLKYYKLLSNRRQLEGIQNILDEMEDQFGKIPEEVNNLITFLKIRIQLQGFGLNKLILRAHSVILSFNKDFIEQNPDIQSNIVSFFMQRPKIYKINPDFSINCKFNDKIDLETLFEFAKHIAEHIKT